MPILAVSLAICMPGAASVPSGTASSSPTLDRIAGFALVIGVNRSVDEELRPLRYADDDAVQYFELFRSLGLRATLVTRPDANTRRLHPQALAEAHLPVRAAFDQVIRGFAAEVARARHRGLETVMYVVYAGHGNVKGGRGYISLEDGRLSSDWIQRELIERLGADQTHLIVDACHSYFLAHTRGPGGSRRSLQAGFSELKQAFPPERVGLLLSTTRARESHEWEAFQAGVFSHEVRSGLYGAADADGNGRVTYKEIAAFVTRANAAIPNDRFRPEVFARPPSRGSVLLDLRRRERRTLEVGKAQAGRYLLENSRGVRLADFHSRGERPLQLLLPRGRGLLYLRRLSDKREYAIPAHAQRVVLASLTPQQPRAESRGAAHHAFSLLFAWPFDQQVVDRFSLQRPPAVEPTRFRDRPPGSRWKSIVGWGGLALSAASLAGALTLTFRAQSLADRDRDLPHAEAAALNDQIQAHDVGAAALYGLAGVAAVAAAVAWFWPTDEPPPVVAAPTVTGFAVSGWF